VVKVWDTRSGELRHELAGGQAAFLSQGKHILTQPGRAGSQFSIYETETGHLVRSFGSNDPPGRDLWVAPDGTTVVSRAEDHSLHLWDIGTGNELTNWSGGPGRVPHLFPPESRFAWRRLDAQIWHAGEVSLVLPAVLYTPDSKYVLVRLDGKTWHAWDIAAGKETNAFSKVTNRPGLAAFLPGGDKIVDCWGAPFKITDVATGKEVSQIHWGRDAIEPRARRGRISADGRRILTDHPDDTVRLYEDQDETYQELGRINFGSEGYLLCFSADGHAAAAASRDGRLVVIRLPDPPPAKENP
jgi:WD40 repeat protein